MVISAHIWHFLPILIQWKKEESLPFFFIGKGAGFFPLFCKYLNYLLYSSTPKRLYPPRSSLSSLFFKDRLLRDEYPLERYAKIHSPPHSFALFFVRRPTQNRPALRQGKRIGNGFDRAYRSRRSLWS